MKYFQYYLRTALIYLSLFLFQGIFAQDAGSLILSGIKDRTPLEEYLAEKASGNYRFFYADDLLDDVYLYPTDNGKELVDYLNTALPQKGLSYIVYKNKNIVFISKSQLAARDQANYAEIDRNGGYYSSVDIGDPMLAGKYKKAKLSGYLRDGATGEPLPGAVIYLTKTDAGVVTDHSGYYAVEMPVGKQSVNFSYVGFEKMELDVNMISPGNLDIELFESTYAIDQVVITSNSDANVVSTESSIVRLDSKTLNTIPVLMGEPDLMKTMTLLPGIQSSGDLASGFNVRGGGSDQNLILIDGVPIYNSNHLFGMFSIVDTRNIDNLELFKGSAPARYGGRLSAFMDINLKEGNFKEYKGAGNLGLFSSKLSLEGPLVKEKASFMIGGRTTYSDWILKNVPDLEIRNSRANFYDFNAKVNVVFNRDNRLSLFTYQSHDLFNLAGRNLFEYTNRLGAVRWNHIVNENFTFSTNVFYSAYNTGTMDTENPVTSFKIGTGIAQGGADFRSLLTIGEKHSVEAGIEANHYSFSSGTLSPYGEESEAEEEALEPEQSLELAVYIQDVYNISKNISLSAGLRYSYYIDLGPRTINLYEGDYISQSTFTGTETVGNNEAVAHYSGLEPRLGLRYVVGENSSLKLGLSRNFQYMHILSNSTVVIPTDTWKSSDRYIKPAVGDQVSLGYFKNFLGGLIETSVEGYYKRVKNALEFKPGAQLVMNDAIEQDVISADVEAYGIELLVKKTAGRLTGWVGYTYSRSFYQTSGAVAEELINRGEKYPSYFDKPHDLSVVASYKISRRFTFSTSFSYSTGKPATFPEMQLPVSSMPVVYYSDRNKYRLPDYHRLDASLIWDTSLKKNRKFYSCWILSVYNVYGHKNIYSTYYQKAVPTAANNYRAYAFYELSIIGIPIPSITYNIRF
ncbi:MAG: TonB-dependent receptor [Bacteroidales bacterium]|nr:TonB-dependent receptor [Bacteroidales bacterium]